MNELYVRKWDGALTPEEFESLVGDLSEVLRWIVIHLDVNPTATFQQYVEVSRIISENLSDMADNEADKLMPISEMSKHRRRIMKKQKAMKEQS